MNAADADYLREALALAAKGAAQTSPNPMVGAVVVREGTVVGRGFHIYARRRSTRKCSRSSRPAERHAAPRYTSLSSPARTRDARRPARMR